MDAQLKQIENRYSELTMRMADPAVYEDNDAYLRIVKELSELEPIVTASREFSRLRLELEQTDDLYFETDASEIELREMIRAERSLLSEQCEEAERVLRQALIPGDPNDDKDVYLEIRGGAGGDEAALFAQDLYRMYLAYADKRGYTAELIDISETGLSGIKEVVVMLRGKGAYSRLKYEIGVHRVQRVPITESGGRIHTSTCTVAVMPEVEDVKIDIDPSDLQIDTYRASGAGGQHVNKTSSAIRITHLPTGVVVTCQDQRSQHKNKDRAMSVLRSRLYDLEQNKLDSQVSADRKKQVGTGDRSERIRTYNFHQSRVTDHRINLTIYKLDDILNGDLDQLIDPLIAADRAAAVERPNEIWTKNK